MILQAEGGQYLTQSADIPIAERVFGQTVHISNASEASQWRQVSEAEKEELINAGTIFDPSDLSDKYLDKVDMLLVAIAENINTAGLTVEQSLKHKGYFPRWNDLTGNLGSVSFRFVYEDTLYEVIQEHTFSEEWIPGIGTESLYKVVTEGHKGTKDDPIPWERNMELKYGLYYTDKEMLYLCIRDSGMGMSFDLSDLVSGGFVEVVTEEPEQSEPGGEDTVIPDAEDLENN